MVSRGETRFLLLETSVASLRSDLPSQSPLKKFELRTPTAAKRSGEASRQESGIEGEREGGFGGVKIETAMADD